MDLYFIRHADAVPLGEQGITQDEDRPLTDLGLEQARTVASGLQRHGIRLDLVLSSPLVRARQTAEGILRQWTLPAPELRFCDQLIPGARSKRLARYLKDLDGNSFGLVGHMPDLAEHAAWLIGSKRAQLDIAKAGIAHIHCDDKPAKGAGTLQWLVTPEWLAPK